MGRKKRKHKDGTAKTDNDSGGTSRTETSKVTILDKFVFKKDEKQSEWEREMELYDKDSEKKKARMEAFNRHKRKMYDSEEHHIAELKRLRAAREKQIRRQKEERKLYVGGLTLHTTEKELTRYFDPYGQVVECRIMREKRLETPSSKFQSGSDILGQKSSQGRSRGFAFVTFSCSFMTEAVLDDNPRHELNGAYLNVRRVNPNPEDYEGLKEGGSDDEDLLMTDYAKFCRKKRSLFVGSLTACITEFDLVDYFSTYGTVIGAHKIVDVETGQPKTFGFVDFAEYGVVPRVMKVHRHFIHRKRIRVDVTRPRVEYSHHTRTIFVGGLNPSITDTHLLQYFAEFGKVDRALRIRVRQEDLERQLEEMRDRGEGHETVIRFRKFGFVDFYEYDSVDVVMSVPDHMICETRVHVELALPMIYSNDSLYDKSIFPKGSGNTSADVFNGDSSAEMPWHERVYQRLQLAVPNSGTWGATISEYDLLVRNNEHDPIKSIQFKIDRSLLEYVVGQGGKVVSEIADDTNTRIRVDKPESMSKFVVFNVIGVEEDILQAQYILTKIVKSKTCNRNQKC